VNSTVFETTELTATRTGSLDVFFRPKSVAVIGASDRERSVGRVVYENLLAGPAHTPVFAVHPTKSLILGRKTYAHVGAIPYSVDLAVIVTPAATVAEVVRDCAKHGVRGAIVISGGFREIGPEGIELERQVLAEARKGNIRIVGPNCLGVMSSFAGLNATFAGTMIQPGNVAFLSQSGALCTAMLDWSMQECVGFSAFFSVGAMLDVGWGDLIHYLGDDPNTTSIVLYMETVGDARSFLSAAREVALSKPIIVIKAGRTEVAAKAVSSHTGSLAGSDDVLDAAFERCGVLRVNTISDVFYMVESLSKQPRPRGPRLTILTNAGGPGVLATDALAASGGVLAELSPETITELNTFLPAQWSRGNPVDIIGDAGPERYTRALEILASDPASDGLLVIMTPQGTSDPTTVAQFLAPHARTTSKPLLASWMGASSVRGGIDILNRAGIPTFPYPDTAARSFEYLWKYSRRLRSLYETPVLDHTVEATEGKVIAEKLIDSVRAEGRTLLDEFESKQLLEAYGIPTVQTIVAETENGAVGAADAIGYPAVLKLHSKTITHKTDVGGVKLNLLDEDAVRYAYREIHRSVSTRASAADFQGVTVQPMIRASDGYELVIGATSDDQFGPVLLFGSGGQLVEVYRDRALGLPPLNTTLARRLMEKTKIWTALQGVRGRKPVDVRALEQLLVRFSQLVVEQRWIREIDINPLFASSKHLLALDARIVLHDTAASIDDIPQTAIRPYPHEWVRQVSLRDGTAVTVRPIRPEDEPAMVAFHTRLSERTVYQRYFSLIKLEARITHERLARICFVDYDRQMVLVAERRRGEGEREIVGVSRLVKIPDTANAEFAVVIADDYQGKSLGTEMVRAMFDFAHKEKIRKIIAEILPENHNMIDFCKRLGFRLKADPRSTVVKAELPLG
jgi:acetyltransferase